MSYLTTKQRINAAKERIADLRNRDSGINTISDKGIIANKSIENISNSIFCNIPQYKDSNQYIKKDNKTHIANDMMPGIKFIASKMIDSGCSVSYVSKIIDIDIEIIKKCLN